MSTDLIRKIHVGCRQLGVDADTRHDLQLRLVGKASLKDMTDAEQQTILDALKERGFRPTRSGKNRLAPRGDLRLVHVLWAALGNAGALTDPTRKGLNAFIRSRFSKPWGFELADIDQLREADKIEDVLSALKAWVGREVPDFDWGRIRR
ncbi:GemA protein [Sagittula sp. P11]|uniref:gp16 family protein n=1 Tax=Sagittula sp. P11 TaxID=2009329 RepID=UPI000C2D4145|nr:regulatory protein GemA [Sagittula sp. P11]AUC54262.1 GemA protein [Sagittula sp. P11]